MPTRREPRRRPEPEAPPTEPADVQLRGVIDRFRPPPPAYARSPDEERAWPLRLRGSAG